MNILKFRNKLIIKIMFKRKNFFLSKFNNYSRINNYYYLNLYIKRYILFLLSFSNILIVILDLNNILLCLIFALTFIIF